MLGTFDPESLDLYNQLVEAEMPMEYSEEVDNYDFARCVRSDGTAYGTGGRCRLGTEAGPAKKNVSSDREAVNKMRRSASELTPKERAAREARQKENAANRQAQAGAADAARREADTAARRERKKSLIQRIKEKLASRKATK